MSSKNMYCINCNCRGHNKKNCILPIVSNGIILFKIEGNVRLNNLDFEYFMKNNYDTATTDEYEINKNIKFLLVQRKHSLGYLEFMRGKYDVNVLNDNDNLSNPGINYLIEQMSPDEIENIINGDFDEMWNNLWSDNAVFNDSRHYEEYCNSKEKYETFRRMYKAEQLSTSMYGFNEWGFPKGRRNKYEDDFKCAIRELYEETNINHEKVKVYKNFKNIRENMKGTNGVEYLHNYYLGYSYNRHIEGYVDGNNYEIKDIKFMDIEECMSVLRPYHTEKIDIIKRLYVCINKFIKHAT